MSHRPAHRAGAATVRPGRWPDGSTAHTSATRTPPPGMGGYPPPPPPGDATVPSAPRIPRGPAPRRRAGRPELSDAAVVSRSWGMAVATLVSRITGFIRIVLLAAILGAALSSAFTVANQLPNLVAALVLEATFTAIFVPVLARAERDDADGGTAFVRRLVTLATALLLVATVVSVAAAPLLVGLMLGGDPLVNRPLTTAFAYLLLPQMIFYGLSSVFMAILNTRNVFGPPAWAPVVNNVVAILTLGLYLVCAGRTFDRSGRDGQRQAAGARRRHHPGCGRPDRRAVGRDPHRNGSACARCGVSTTDFKQFGRMAAAMVLYVLISQIGLIVGNQIASAAAASGPAIYNYTWLVLMLPFGMIGVTVLTVVMPRLSRNAAANDGPRRARRPVAGDAADDGDADPVVAFMTVGGPAIGSALFAYGNFGDVDAGYLGMAITLSAFTLIPYALVLLQLRVFYAREQPWTPIVLIVVITAVKIAASLAAPHLTDDPRAGRRLPRSGQRTGLPRRRHGRLLSCCARNLNPPGGRLHPPRRGAAPSCVTITASLAAGLVAHVVDRLLGLGRPCTEHDVAAAPGRCCGCRCSGLIMLPIIAAVMLAARVPDAQAALAAVRRRLGKAPTEPGGQSRRPSDHAHGCLSRTLSRGIRSAPRGRHHPTAAPARASGRRLPEHGMRKGPAVTDESAGDSAPRLTTVRRHGCRARPPTISSRTSPPTRPDRPRHGAGGDAEQGDPGTMPVSTVSPPTSGRPPADYGGDPTREPLPFDIPREPPIEAATADEDVHLIPGATIAGGRYRLLVFHGGPPHLQFWQALDTALDRQVGADVRRSRRGTVRRGPPGDPAPARCG